MEESGKINGRDAWDLLSGEAGDDAPRLLVFTRAREEII